MSLKLISWNVNGIRAAQKKGLIDYIEKENPDILCLQETKAHPDQLDDILKTPKGYHSNFHSCSIKKGYSGVVTYTKEKPVTESVGFNIEKFDQEGRVTQSDYNEFTLFNVYFPNGRRNERLDYKMEFFEEFFKYCNSLREKGKKLIICGDYNIAHKAIDLARPKDNEKTSGFMPEERDMMDKIVNMKYLDTFRIFNNEPGWYTWWSMQTKARERNIGWRIDYFFVSDDLKNNVKNSVIKTEQMGSDHCPLILELDF